MSRFKRAYKLFVAGNEWDQSVIYKSHKNGDNRIVKINNANIHQFTYLVKKYRELSAYGFSHKITERDAVYRIEYKFQTPGGSTTFAYVEDAGMPAIITITTEFD